MVEDENGRIVVANAAFCRMFGVGHPSEVVGRLAQDLREELWPKLIDDVDGVRLLTRRLRERRAPHRGDEVRLTDGRVMNRDYVPVDAPGGGVAHLWHYRDITSAKELERRLRQSRSQVREFAAHFPRLGDRPSFSDVTPIARLVAEDFLEGSYDEISVVYPGFVSTLTQRATVTTLLPVPRPAELDPDEAERTDEYLFEPSAEAVLRRLLPHYVAVDLFRAVLEANASEQSARMIAMRSATDNANELMGDLTLVYNKTRQATITREMIEIASGAEALGG